jgi:hypothetical protein
MSNDLRVSVLAAMESLGEVLQVINEADAVEEAPAAPTVQEISENVSGNPNLWAENPDLYAKMEKFYNPAKQPFTTDTWMTTGLLGYGSKPRQADGYLRDPRPYKVEDRDGVPFQKCGPYAGPDWYWIGAGVSDVAAPEWNKQEISHDDPREVKLDRIRAYKGGLRQSVNSWPATERQAYNESH